MRLYLDNCCYNRPFDDRSNIKNYLEREAVLLIMQKIYDGELNLIGSEAILKEMSAIRNIKKRRRVESIYHSFEKEEIRLDSLIAKRAKEIASKIGTTSFDSLHLAVAENYADYCITTDSKLIKASKRMDMDLNIMNPIEFLMEVLDNE